MATETGEDLSQTVADKGFVPLVRQLLARGTQIGRYVVLEPIGQGGMGSVYRAFDPELNRSVALKVLSFPARTASQSADPKGAAHKTRLLREAQALAQLSHPNVIAVHDVGTVDDDVFIAMEFVQGKTLRRWLKEETPARKDTLGVLLEVGRGLAAAHHAGLVHRDVKPENIILGDDGRVRVIDFGLARATDKIQLEEAATLASVSHSAEGIPTSKDPSLNSLSDMALLTPLTQQGVILGTPPYMAPEQFLWSAVDEKSDQYSFCVVAWEALFGVRPFVASTLRELKKKVLIGSIDSPPPDRQVPPWIRRILEKGLAKDPADRHPGMDALLALLESDPAVGRRRWLALGGALLLLALGVALGLRAIAARDQLCRGAEGQLAGVWDAPTRARVSTAFLGTGKPFAQDAWSGVERTLGAYARGWTELYTRTCQATRIHRAQSEPVMDLKMACLARRLNELRALVSLFARADGDVVEKAVPAASALVPLLRCADASALVPRVLPPPDEPTRRRVEEIRGELSRVQALLHTGKFAQGLGEATRARDAAQEIAYRPLQAEALYWLGRLELAAGEYQKAQDSLSGSMQMAIEAGDEEQQARGAIGLVQVAGGMLSRYELAEWLARQTQSLLRWLGKEDELTADLWFTFGELAFAQNRFEEALADYQKALALHKRISGPEHPVVARCLRAIANVLDRKGDFNAALAYYADALRLTEASLGPIHPRFAEALVNKASCLRALGRFAEAIQIAERALSIFQSSLQEDHPTLGTLQTTLGNLYFSMGQQQKSIEHHLRALQIWQRAFGADHPRVAYCLINLGNAQAELKQWAASLDHYRRALEILEKTQGQDNPDLAYPLDGVGNVLTRMGQPAQAVPYLERATAICRKQACESEIGPEVKFFLAKALWESGQDRARARLLAQEVAEDYQKLPGREKELADVVAWLSRL